MRAIMTAVGFSDILAVTLPRNRHHFSDVMVVTAPGDPAIEIAWNLGCKVLATSAWWANGADFNKWLGLELGLDAFGRHGPMTIMDCDVIWPKELPPGWMREVEQDGRGLLYTPLRRMMVNLPVPLVIPPESEWDRFPHHRVTQEWSGYSQIFHADDPALERRPWFETCFRHAGNSDSLFQSRFGRERKVRPPWECLHLGPAGVNWLGRTSPLLDGSIPEGTDERRLRLAEIWRLRRVNKNFEHEKI